MSQAKPDDDSGTRSAPRVVLLATDRSQSIIGEIVDGQTKTIGYSAYGEQSAQQKVETRLGFNGQLREADIGWYLLGNGYRAYNPRLMRFHSPDSWSPFRGGGLNAYMYCVGDPVNRVDPTGHVPWIEPWLKKFAGNAAKFILGGSEITGPSRSKALKATVGTGRRMSAEHGDLAAMSNVAGAVAAGSPTVVTTGRYPSMGDGSTHGTRWGTTPPYVSDRRAPQRTRSVAPRQAGSTATESGPPPSYEEAMSTAPPSYKVAKLLSNHDTFAASQQGNTFVVNRVADPNHQYFNFYPPHMEHPQLPNVPRPSWVRSPSPSPVTSRDSTPPRSRNPSGDQPTWRRIST